LIYYNSATHYINAFLMLAYVHFVWGSGDPQVVFDIFAPK